MCVNFFSVTRSALRGADVMEFHYIFCVLIFLVCCNAAPPRSFYPDGSRFTPPGTITTELIPGPPKMEAIYPRGLRVSVPAFHDYKSFGFRGNLKRKHDNLVSHTWEEEVHEKTNNRWEFRDKITDLQLGDTIYYWVFVTMGDSMSKGLAREWTVTEFVNEDGTHANVQSSIPLPTPTPTIVASTLSNTDTTHCADSRTEIKGNANICQGALVFSEEFDKDEIEQLVNWDPEIMFPLEPDYPFNVYMPEGTVSLQNGVLNMSSQLLESKYHEGKVRETLDLTNRCSGLSGTLECVQTASGAQILSPVVTGKITTRRKFNFKYGRVEVRAKLPRGDWLLPEITLEPSDNAYGRLRFESGLMRVAFARGNDIFAKNLYGGPVLYDQEPYRSQFMSEKIGSDNWNKDYHNYTMIWKPDSIEWFVDGEMYGTVHPGMGFYQQLSQKGAKDVKRWMGKTRLAPLDEMFYVALGLRVGGINDFADSPGKPWRNKSSKAKINFWKAKDNWFPTWTDGDMNVDYVRIYAL